MCYLFMKELTHALAGVSEFLVLITDYLITTFLPLLM